jgi:hypothetical protein
MREFKFFADYGMQVSLVFKPCCAGRRSLVLWRK